MDLSKVELRKEDFLSYKAQLENSIRVSKMQRLTDEITLIEVIKKLAEFPEEVEETTDLETKEE